MIYYLYHIFLNIYIHTYGLAQNVENMRLSFFGVGQLVDVEGIPAQVPEPPPCLADKLRVGG